jgi:molybdenum-dependent DNA-binding transcriptional regulator ModE
VSEVGRMIMKMFKELKEELQKQFNESRKQTKKN